MDTTVWTTKRENAPWNPAAEPFIVSRAHRDPRAYHGWGTDTLTFATEAEAMAAFEAAKKVPGSLESEVYRHIPNGTVQGRRERLARWRATFKPRAPRKSP